MCVLSNTLYALTSLKKFCCAVDVAGICYNFIYLRYI